MAGEYSLAKCIFHACREPGHSIRAFVQLLQVVLLSQALLDPLCRDNVAFVLLHQNVSDVIIAESTALRAAWNDMPLQRVLLT